MEARRSPTDMIIALDGLSGATTAGRLEFVGVVGRDLGVFGMKKSGVERKNRGSFWLKVG